LASPEPSSLTFPIPFISFLSHPNFSEADEFTRKICLGKGDFFLKKMISCGKNLERINNIGCKRCFRNNII
jgi:hypothetical protein